MLILISNQKSQKSSWIFSGIFQWMFSDIFQWNFNFQRYLPKDCHLSSGSLQAFANLFSVAFNSLPKIRRQGVFKAVSVPETDELQKLLSVGPEGYAFSKQCSKSNDNPWGKTLRNQLQMLFSAGVRAIFRVVIVCRTSLPFQSKYIEDRILFPKTNQNICFIIACMCLSISSRTY